MDLIFARLESVQSRMFPPTIFDGKIERELNLSDGFVDSYVIAYSLLEELLATAAASRTSYADLVALWTAIESGQCENQYDELSKSEFGRVVIYLIDSAVHLK